MHLRLILKNQELTLCLEKGYKTLATEQLTLSRDFDILLIITLDKILRKNRMDRLSLKNVKIAGKLRPGVVSGMIIKTLALAITA